MIFTKKGFWSALGTLIGALLVIFGVSSETTQAATACLAFLTVLFVRNDIGKVESGALFAVHDSLSIITTRTFWSGLAALTGALLTIFGAANIYMQAATAIFTFMTALFVNDGIQKAARAVEGGERGL
jgi:hypothetical protein